MYSLLPSKQSSYIFAFNIPRVFNYSQVVCAGAKSILDIPRTLEFLETQGVPVVAYQTNEFPAFFTPKSGCLAPLRLDSPKEIAKFLHAAGQLYLQNGAVIAVPVPKDQAGDAGLIKRTTTQALNEVIEKKIKGRDITPYLLDRINQLTGGHSLKANINLVLNNAKIGTKVAVELAKLRSPSL
mmetsp:Transcript_16519/g.26171  ORF Transcript_16519/g.26171 Transcript_16519/m.26171 type:complete len:183 (-) Transcript_16519:69-617(-)